VEIVEAYHRVSQPVSIGLILEEIAVFAALEVSMGCALSTHHALDFSIP